jgi:hypothetical protein
VAEEAEPQFCQIIPVENNVDDEPMLMYEEVQQVEEEHEGELLQPYQLTNYYWLQQLHFEEQFNTWVRQYKDEQLMLFEQQQQQHYEGALLIAEHEQQYLPNGENGNDEVNEGDEVTDDNEAIDNIHDDVVFGETEQEVMEEYVINFIINNYDDANDNDEEENNNNIINPADEDDDNSIENMNIIIHAVDEVNDEENNNIIIDAADSNREDDDNFIEQHKEQQLANGHVPLQ